MGILGEKIMKTVAYISLTPYLDLQRRFLVEDYKVKLWFSSDVAIKDDANLSALYPNLSVCNGYVEDCLKDSDLIFLDYSSPRDIINKVLAYVKINDTPVFGLCPEAFFELEDQRDVGQKLAEQLGYESVATKVFKEKQDILDYIQSNPNIVVKTRDGIFPTFIPGHKDELEYVLESDILEAFKDKKDLFVQPFVEGFEFNTSYYFNGENFIPYVFITQEYKGAFTKNIGNVLTGEVGTIAKVVPLDKLRPRYYKIMKKLEKAVKQLPNSKYYRGLIDINQILSEDGRLYFLEFTTRIGVPSPEFEINFITKSFPEFAEYVSGVSSKPPNFNLDTFVFGCCYSYGYPYPSAFEEAKGAISIGNLDMKDDIALLAGHESITNNKLIIHTYTDRIAITYGKGKNLEKALKDYKNRVANIKGYSVIYRTDIGYKWDEDILHSKILYK
jgi:phosphoribosylamine-glycine ligase